MGQTFETIDGYIAAQPQNVRVLLRQLYETVKKAAPKSTEKFSYGIPTFYLNGNLVHFAAFKSHIGFYPTPGAITVFKKELAGYKQAKGSVQFPLDEPLPLPLITKIVVFRVKENMQKKERNI